MKNICSKCCCVIHINDFILELKPASLLESFLLQFLERLTAERRLCQIEHRRFHFRLPITQTQGSASVGSYPVWWDSPFILVRDTRRDELLWYQYGIMACFFTPCHCGLPRTWEGGCGGGCGGIWTIYINRAYIFFPYDFLPDREQTTLHYMLVRHLGGVFRSPSVVWLNGIWLHVGQPLQIRHFGVSSHSLENKETAHVSAVLISGCRSTNLTFQSEALLNSIIVSPQQWGYRVT